MGNNFTWELSVFNLHDHLQTVAQLTVFQFVTVDHSNPQLCGTVPGCGVAPSGRDDGCFGTFSTKPITQNGKFIESLCLDITDFAADEKRDDSSGCHHIDLIDDTGVTQNFIPANYDASVVDEVMGISDEEAFRTARELAMTEGMLVGISSGAALCSARKLAERPEYEGKFIVVLLPDGGERYLSTELFG